jgi:hypothetical protein
VNTQLSRRTFLATTSALATGLFAGTSPAAEDSPRKPRVAAINSIYRFKSHAYHIAGRFIHGYTVDGFHHQPPFDLVSMYNDQSPPDDLGPRVCEHHKIRLAKTPEEALGANGGLDVDAVLLIVEHGDYPLNEYGQILYPRFELYERVVKVFEKAGRAVPVFCDKHLSYDHAKAAKMVETSRRLKFGLMAGSSLPVTWRKPSIEPPVGTLFEEGLVVLGYERGPIEIYLFHALEVLQTMLERRQGGETGVKSIAGISGDAVWKAADEGRWSPELLEAALSRCPSRNIVPLRQDVRNPLAFLIEYQDGTSGTVLNLIEATSDFGFAGRIRGQKTPVSTCFYLPQPPGARFFDPLTYNIEKLFRTGSAPYPVERTLLTSTLCDLAMHSLKDRQPATGPALKITYAAPKHSGFFQGPIPEGGNS